MDAGQVTDIVEIEQLLARWAVAMMVDDTDGIVGAFTEDGTYSAFGDTYDVARFLELKKAAPKGLYLTGTPAVVLDGDVASGVQPLCFVDQTDHSTRLGYYTDTYRRTPAGWRLKSRSTTFLRRSGARDAGRTDDPSRPASGTTPSSDGRSG